MFRHQKAANSDVTMICDMKLKEKSSTNTEKKRAGSSILSCWFGKQCF